MPGLNAIGELTQPWRVDGQFTLAPAGSTRPAAQRQQALCTLLGATARDNWPVAQLVPNQSGLTFVLSRVTIADHLPGAGSMAGDQAWTDSSAPPTPWHNRLAWVAIIDPPIIAECGTAAPKGGSSSATTASTSAAALVPWQFLVLDADGGSDGFVYASSTDAPCLPSHIDVGYVSPLEVGAPTS